MRIKDDKKIESIKLAAIKLIQELGFHGSSVSKIAKEAGVSPATIYIYYDNKEDMLREIYLELKKNMFTYIFKNITNDMDAKMTFYSICKSYYEYIEEYKEEYNFIKQFKSCPALCEKCEGEMDYISKVNNLINRFKEQGIIKSIDNKLIFSFLLFSIEGISENKSNGIVFIPDSMLESVYEMIWDGIRVR